MIGFQKHYVALASANDVERIVCFLTERTNSRKRCATIVSTPSSTKSVSIQEITKSRARQGLFRDPATDNQPPDIGIKLPVVGFHRLQQ